MTDKTSNDNRRKLLKSIVAGSGAVVAGKTLPEAWTKPVVDSVMLPAHAATTGEEPCCLIEDDYCGFTQATTKEDLYREKFYVRIVVKANGSIEAEVLDECLNFSGSTTIPCTGGPFTIKAARVNSSFCAVVVAVEDAGEATRPMIESMQITGTVICGSTKISGTAKYGVTDYTYDASSEDCKPAQQM